ncbi:Blue copper [Quillaja saponaria]|uniref:Blue copper n=1 Tax=Quillaja saponaria TaxID=32244 RepID=A0AAD7M664_QUISA|nr:Blue copper [Quillaja saponaria]
MGSIKIIFLVLVSIFITKEALAAQHVVGGSQGWDASTDFNSWLSGKIFKVGDQLVFKYTSGMHSVIELGSEKAFKNCDIGSVVDSMNTGSDVIKLNKPGTRYFACGTLSHCDQGMKVKITTVAAGNAPSSPSTSSSSPTTTSAASSASQSFVFPLLMLVAFSVTLLL